MLASAFILGLLGSFHCVGMCGPIAFVLPVDRNNSVKKVGQIALYHLGRLIAYSLLGLFFGVIGKGFLLFGIQQQLSIVIGVLMIIIVILPHKTLNKFSLSKPIYHIISKLKSKLGQQFKRRTPDTFFTIGFLNGFLPCGLVYMAVFGSIAFGGSFKGAIYMMLFGLGTIPLMTTAIYLSKFLNTTIKQKIQRAIPVFLVIIGMLFILRGMGLDIPYISPSEMVAIPEVSEGKQCH